MSIKLTQLSHGGGCGCKIGPTLLQDMLRALPLPLPDANLLVGNETSDDAAVYRLNDHQALVATTDFFMPIVDDPYDFGRIAATNAISDIYAMGGKPILGLAIVGMPIERLPVEVIGQILSGGASVARDAGFQIGGGHSIDAPEPIYGLAVLGLVHPNAIKRNGDARPGDMLVLTKPLGVGVLGSALKKGRVAPEEYTQMLAVTTQLNRAGQELAAEPGVHAMTDVTGFGLLGHLMEVCRASHVRASLQFSDIPLIAAAARLVQEGIRPAATARNLEATSPTTGWDSSIAEWQKYLLADPQTSGGLLVSCAPDRLDQVLAICRAQGAFRPAVIGQLAAGEAGIEVLP
jgi:selenide,water dikinase